MTKEQIKQTVDLSFKMIRHTSNGESIVSVVKELMSLQDEYTRHTCGEAVLNLAETPGEKIDVTKAHAACISAPTNLF